MDNQEQQPLKDDSSATTLWKMYSKAKAGLPYRSRMENLTWRLMYLNMKKRDPQTGDQDKIKLADQIDSPSVDNVGKANTSNEGRRNGDEMSVSPKSTGGISPGPIGASFLAGNSPGSDWPQFPDLGLLSRGAKSANAQGANAPDDSYLSNLRKMGNQSSFYGGQPQEKQDLWKNSPADQPQAVQFNSMPLSPVIGSKRKQISPVMYPQQSKLSQSLMGHMQNLTVTTAGSNTEETGDSKTTPAPDLGLEFDPISLDSALGVDSSPFSTRGSTPSSAVPPYLNPVSTSMTNIARLTSSGNTLQRPQLISQSVPGSFTALDGNQQQYHMANASSSSVSQQFAYPGILDDRFSFDLDGSDFAMPGVQPELVHLQQKTQPQQSQLQQSRLQQSQLQQGQPQQHQQHQGQQMSSSLGRSPGISAKNSVAGMKANRKKSTVRKKSTTKGAKGRKSSASHPNVGGASKNGVSQEIFCTNCHTKTTPLWRRNPEGKPLCNACGLFLKLHGVVRPLSLKTDVIKKRQRQRNNSKRTKKKSDGDDLHPTPLVLGKRSEGGISSAGTPSTINSRRKSLHGPSVKASGASNVNIRAKSSSSSGHADGTPNLGQGGKTLGNTPLLGGQDPFDMFDMKQGNEFDASVGQLNAQMKDLGADSLEEPTNRHGLGISSTTHQVMNNAKPSQHSKTASKQQKDNDVNQSLDWLTMSL